MFLRWDKGRQGTGYSKLALLPTFISNWLKADAYILHLPDQCSIPRHIDPAVNGYAHYRLNFTFWKSGPEVMYVDGPVSRWWRFEFFRPDLYKHGLHKISGRRFMFSVGWLRKIK